MRWRLRHFICTWRNQWQNLPTLIYVAYRSVIYCKMQDKTNSPQQKCCEETLQSDTSWETQQEKVFCRQGEGQKCRKQRLHFLFWEWFTVVLKNKKCGVSATGRGKMVSYTIFSYGTKPLFSLASSPIRLLLNLLSSAKWLPSPLVLDSKAVKAEVILGGGHPLCLRNNRSF